MVKSKFKFEFSLHLHDRMIKIEELYREYSTAEWRGPTLNSSSMKKNTYIQTRNNMERLKLGACFENVPQGKVGCYSGGRGGEIRVQ